VTGRAMTAQAPIEPQRRADWFELFFDLVSW
jgi:low temperature requirement protein LtrA